MNRKLGWLAAALACMAAVAQAQLPPGTIVLFNDWAGQSGAFSNNFSAWPLPRSFFLSDSGVAGVSGGQWVDAGATATNVGIAFRGDAASPFPSPFPGRGNSTVGLVIFGDTDGTGRNGPRLNSGIADIENNPAGICFQFDTKVSDDYSGAALLSWYWPNNDQFGIHFGGGHIAVPLPSSWGGGFTNLTPFAPDTWYRITVWTVESWASVASYDVSVTTFGGPTNVFLNLAMPDGASEHSRPFGMEFHSGALGNGPPDTPNGAWAIDNVLVAIGNGDRKAAGGASPPPVKSLSAAAAITPTLHGLLTQAIALAGPAPESKHSWFYSLMHPSGARSHLILKRGDKIVAIGDSITQAGGYLRDGDFVLAAQYPDLEIPPIINVGISGQKAEDLAGRFDRDVIARHPAVVTLSIGINDVWHRLARPHDPQVLTNYIANVTKMVRDAQAARIRVILLAPTIIGEDANSEGNKRLVMYVEAERQIAQTTGCEFMDLHRMFLEALKQKPPAETGNWLTQDGVHMKPLGDAIMAVGVLRGLGVSDAKIAGD